MSDIRTVTATLGFSNTESTRKMKFTDVSAEALANCKATAKAINASLAGGTDGGLKEFIRSDDYDASDPNNIVGEFTGIVALESYNGTETEINLNV